MFFFLLIACLLFDEPFTEHTSELRFVILRLLLDWINHNWASLNASERQSLRGMILSYITSQALRETKPLRSMLASMLTSVAKQDYPQNWPSFVQDLLQLWRQNCHEISEVRCF